MSLRLNIEFQSIVLEFGVDSITYRLRCQVDSDYSSCLGDIPENEYIHEQRPSIQGRVVHSYGLGVTEMQRVQYMHEWETQD